MNHYALQFEIPSDEQWGTPLTNVVRAILWGFTEDESGNPGTYIASIAEAENEVIAGHAVITGHERDLIGYRMPDGTVEYDTGELTAIECAWASMGHR